MRCLPVIRVCSDCQACCEVMQITETEKPAGERCPQQCEKGCGIYSRRPSECRIFKCLWLAETDPKLMKYARFRKAPRIFSAQDRPDISGLLFHAPDETSLVFERETGLMPGIVREVWPGAAEQEQGRRIIERFAGKRLVILVRGDQRRAFGPPEQIQRMAAFIRRRTG